MDFKDMLEYARVFKAEQRTYCGVRDMLEEIQNFDRYEFDVFEMIRYDYSIKESIEIIHNNDYRYYSNIYEYVSEYFDGCGINDIPYWVSIDYQDTFENIRIESNIVYTAWDKPFIEIYY